MGNRAIIKAKGSNIGLYLHWNGGRDSVEAFIKYCELKQYRPIGTDTGYGMARLCQVISNFFGGTTSVGITPCKGTVKEAECIDNGIYVIKGWKIVDRVWYNGKYSKGVRNEEQHEYDLDGMLKVIDESMPEKERLGEDFLSARVVPTSSLKVGDKVYVMDNVYDKMEIKTVVGIGENRIINGMNVRGIPYIDKYGHNDLLDPDHGYAGNCNNYVFDTEVRKVNV